MTKEDAFRFLELYKGWNTSHKSLHLVCNGVRDAEDDIFDERRKTMVEALRVIRDERSPTYGTG